MSEQHETTTPPRISLMAAAELRDALRALGEGRGPAAIASLMAIDADSWEAVEQRLAAIVGNDLRALLLSAAGGTTDTEAAKFLG
ncbi:MULTISPECIES: hypothetical protein [Streptomyces]|uniref:Uncharacterized protein n=1 Tax=Streptomyces corynorhini TaxID=2282652 RepID=A0A370B3U0_9ACTN|nr:MULTISPECIES: hypothetical protein [Streptomyces]RDG36478.1 hypothetical protein DVH02_19690 [Streptomyces corynorhini]